MQNRVVVRFWMYSNSKDKRISHQIDVGYKRKRGFKSLRGRRMEYPLTEMMLTKGRTGFRESIRSSVLDISI